MVLLFKKKRKKKILLEKEAIGSQISVKKKNKVKKPDSDAVL